MPRLRVVLDTNVLVSGLAYPAGIPGQIVRSWREGFLDVVLSRYILDELTRVLPRIERIRLSQAEIRDLVDTLTFTAGIAEPDATEDPRLRDPSDQPVLAVLRASAADYLITGDKDLLALAQRYPVLSPAEFWNRHGA
jgi:putative PIN family toxin of toxin-antitoxin system